MSFVNFRRLFTKTRKLLTEHKFIELKGYTKLGYNTIENMVPFLTGYQLGELMRGFDHTNVTYEEWPIIWKNFSKRGFVTFLDEESSQSRLFHRETKDNRNYVTDYWTHPFHKEKGFDKYRQFCYKDRTDAQVLFAFTEGKFQIKNSIVFYVS